MGREAESSPMCLRTWCPLRLSPELEEEALLRQQGLPLLPSASIFDLQIFRSGHPPIRSNMTLPHMPHASSLPSQDMARTKVSGSSGWVGVMGAHVWL